MVHAGPTFCAKEAVIESPGGNAPLSMDAVAVPAAVLMLQLRPEVPIGWLYDTAGVAAGSVLVTI
jgi:hypothetical protein